MSNIYLSILCMPLGIGLIVMGMMPARCVWKYSKVDTGSMLVVSWHSSLFFRINYLAKVQISVGSRSGSSISGLGPLKFYLGRSWTFNPFHWLFKTFGFINWTVNLILGKFQDLPIWKINLNPCLGLHSNKRFPRLCQQGPSRITGT